MSRIGKSIETEGRLALLGARGRVGWRVTANGVSFWVMKKIWILAVRAVQLREYIKNYRTVYF